MASPKHPFNSFAALARHKKEGRDYNIVVKETGSKVTIVAPHAQNIEPYTGAMAKKIAANDHNLYLFNASRESGGEEMHITSTDFDEPRCLDLVSKSDITITIHGCKGSDVFIYVGGLDHETKNALAAEFNKHGIKALTENHPFLANVPENVCNKNRQKQGVQLEFSRGLRNNSVLRDKAAKIVRDYLKGLQAA